MTASGRVRDNLKRLSWFVVIGVVVGGILGHVNSLMLNQDPVANVVGGLVGGLGVGLTIGTVEVLVFYGRIRRRSFLTLLAVRTASYAACMAVWLPAVNMPKYARSEGLSPIDALIYYIVEGDFLLEFTYVTLAVLVFVWILQLTQLHRGRDLVNFILGRYHQPQEVERVFLFVDLTSSTGIAERLGHLDYSSFLQDFFFDVDSAVLRWGGSIYQYVGDEVIVTWPLKLGVGRAACVECFFAMEDEVRANRDSYVARYRVHPEFRGGMHGGKAVVTWVGGRKKEIVYHGDVLNTASRIQAEAKGGAFSCLISDELLERLELPEAFTTSRVGEVTLRGRKEPLVLHGLKRARLQAAPSGAIEAPGE